MRRVLLAGLAGIALLSGLALALIGLATREPPAAPAATSDADAAAAPAPAPTAPVATPSLLARPAPAPEPAPVAPAERVPPPPRGSWEAVAPVARPRALGPIGPAVQAGLVEHSGALGACFSADAQERHAAVTPVAVRDGDPGAGGGAAVLMLELETLDGAVRIVDAPVEDEGGAPPAALACAQALLRGKLLDVPAARPGARHRLRYTVTF